MKFNTQPPLLYPEYKSTITRSPSRPLMMVKERLKDLSLPAFGTSMLGKYDNDLTKNARIDNLPLTIRGDNVQIRQLFQNLMTNAIKYISPYRTPVITISAQEKGKFWEFEVRDNGIGICKKDFTKIFELFKKLHSDDALGTGIDLNTAKSIVENHGGEIWLTSEYGKGTSFYFTLLKE